MKKQMNLLVIILITGYALFSQSCKNKGNPYIVLAEGAKLEKIAGDFGFTEGITADNEGNVYFSDIPANKIYKIDSGSSVSLLIETDGCNGLQFMQDSFIYIAGHNGGRKINKLNISAKNVEILADNYEGKKFNSPNDLWIDSKGGVFFTDPRYGDTTGLELHGEYVYYLPADKSDAIIIEADLKGPNGVIASADEKILYIGDQKGNKTYSYLINEDGSLKDRKLFADEGSDGMTTDTEGNVYITNQDVIVYSRKGEYICTIDIPEMATNVCFGGTNNSTLYITAETSVYKIEMKTKGIWSN